MTTWQQLIDEATLQELEGTELGRLLRHTLANRRPPAPQRIFTNRTLRMESIHYVGFDLDWTLADYDTESMTQLAFKLTRERLVTHYGYPPAVRKAEYRPGFARRGLLIDNEAGTVVKMNRHRYVGRAYHGRQYLDAGERARLYRHEPINLASDRFYFVDTLFELPEVNLFSEIVELARRKPAAVTLTSFKQLFKDIRAAIDSIHADGTLKHQVLADLPRYLPRDPNLSLALQRMKLPGRRLLLITNSEWYYTDALCTYLFEGFPGITQWRELFDLVVVHAAKPVFFRKTLPFVELDAQGKELALAEVPAWGGLYARGSREGLMKLLDAPGERMLYVGDHIYGDVFSSKRSSTWRTALIVSELAHELEARRDLSSPLRRTEMLRAELADLGQRMDDLADALTLYREVASETANGDKFLRTFQRYLQGLRTEHKVLRHHARRLQEQVSQAINPYWGSIYKQGSNKSLFGSQVDDFACVYTARVSNFAYYGTNHYFRVLRDAMMHESEL